MKIDPNSPAFPLPIAATIDNALVCAGDVPGYHALSGLTIRAEIASRMLAAYRSNPQTESDQRCLKWAIDDADALIAELNKGVNAAEPQLAPSPIYDIVSQRDDLLAMLKLATAALETCRYSEQPLAEQCRALIAKVEAAS